MSGILINIWLKQHPPLRNNIRPWVTCADGFRMSVQASAYHYCTPREAEADWYDAVEVHLCDPHEPLFDTADGRDRDFEDSEPYGYMPVAIVDDVILKHGDIKEEAS